LLDATLEREIITGHSLTEALPALAPTIADMLELFELVATIDEESDLNEIDIRNIK